MSAQGKSLEAGMEQLPSPLREREGPRSGEGEGLSPRASCGGSPLTSPIAGQWGPLLRKGERFYRQLQQIGPNESRRIAITGFVVLFALMLLRVPVAMAMGLVGVTGYGYLVGADRR